MTIKELAAKKGISHQAVYKRIKGAGIAIESLKDKTTGELTEEGERVLLDLFGLNQEPEEAKPEAVATEVAEEVAKLRERVEQLNSEVASLKAHVEDLTGERDYLRKALEQSQQALERSQQLQAMTTAKLPDPVLLLPKNESGVRGWFRSHFGKGAGNEKHNNKGV